MGERTCTVDGCVKPLKARGWCHTHYMQARRSGKAPRVTATTCDECGNEFQSRKHTTCTKCRLGVWPLDRSPRPCEDCGETFTPGGMGPISPRCLECYERQQIVRALDWQRENIDRHRAANAAWREANPEVHARWARENPEKARMSRARSAMKHRDKRNAYKLAWRAKNPDKVRAQSHVRRARLRQVESECFDPIEIFDRDGWQCYLCDEPIDPDLRWPDRWSVSLDHIVPLSRGGGHTRANTSAAHLTCNLHKHNRMPAGN